MGTDAWRNWRALLAGDPESENYDDEAHSDVAFFEGPATFGPFTLDSVIREMALRDSVVQNAGDVGPALLIHGGIHADLMPDLVVNGELMSADSTAYHGGTTSDEIAALVSLELGVRLRVAGTQRLSGIHDGTPRTPMFFEVPRLARPGRPGREVLPRLLMRPARLSLVTRLGSFPSIAEDAQVELVRAARSYATGVWWANEDPNESWLHLVTAVETAAKFRQVGKVDRVDLLRELWPDLWAIVQGVDENVKADLSKKLVPLIRSTKAFVDFLVELAPPPPEPRPAMEDFDWDEMRSHARLVYEHRSRALHSGKPFPMPMLERPRVESSGAVQEAPWGLSAGAPGGSWDHSETPMLLSTFEYIARGALLSWWDELVTAQWTTDRRDE